MIKLFIVDDHELFLEGIKSLVNTLPNCRVVGTATTGSAAIKKIKEKEVDLVLLDINMPDMNGNEALPFLKKNNPNLKVVMLTMINSPSMIQDVLQAGANGYLLKNASKEELQACIINVFNGGKYFGDEVKDAILNSFSSANTVEAIKLTPREQEVLLLICQEHTSQEISENLFLSVNTIESYRKNLFEKTGARNVAGLVKFAYENNFL